MSYESDFYATMARDWDERGISLVYSQVYGDHMSVNWLQLVKLLAGTIIPAVVPHGDVLAPLVAAGIEQAESAKGKTGAEKLQIATQLVHTGIAGVNAVAGSQKIDPTAVDALVKEGISTVVDTANLVQKKSV